MKISVGFSSPKRDNPLSWLIRKVTHSMFSHTWLLVEDSSFKIPLVLEAHFEFRLVPLERFKKSNNVVFLIAPKVSLEFATLDIVKKDLGTPYDTKGIFGDFFVIVAKWFKKKVHNPFRSTDRLFCSESVARVLKASDYPGMADLEPEDMTPEDVLDLLTAE